MPKKSFKSLREKFDSIDDKNEQFKLQSQGKRSGTICSSTSIWTKHIIKPKIANDLKDWSFKRKVTCPRFIESKYPSSRQKVSLICDGKKSRFSFTTAKSPRDVYETKFGDPCLVNVIDNCCLGGQKVPNVVHYIWYADKELGFFQFLSFMSALRFMKPCLFLLHGDYIPKGKYWNHFISISPNVIHVRRKKPTSVFGQKLAYEEHASDIMRIEALISK